MTSYNRRTLVGGLTVTPTQARSQQRDYYSRPDAGEWENVLNAGEYAFYNNDIWRIDSFDPARETAVISDRNDPNKKKTVKILVLFDKNSQSMKYNFPLLRKHILTLTWRDGYYHARITLGHALGKSLASGAGYKTLGEALTWGFNQITKGYIIVPLPRNKIFLSIEHATRPQYWQPEIRRRAEALIEEVIGRRGVRIYRTEILLDNQRIGTILERENRDAYARIHSTGLPQTPEIDAEPQNREVEIYG